MAGFKDLANVWKNVREVDLRPIREEASQPVSLVLAGAPGSGRHTLAAQLRSDPARADIYSRTAVNILDLHQRETSAAADLVVLLVDVGGEGFEREQEAAAWWRDGGKKVVVFGNKLDTLEGAAFDYGRLAWSGTQWVCGSALNTRFLLDEFVPLVLSLLPQQHLALGRQFPLFRVTAARNLINDTCFSNAAYALSTGLAEIVPALGLPLTITDLVVLTKAQAFLVYRLGLLFGFSTRWQDYLAEFGSVIGGGFFWRQLARSLVGLVPVWGIVPKVAVAYAGTYVVGHSVLQWYLTGRRLSRTQISALYKQAFARGKDVALRLVARLPKARFPKKRRKQLPAPTGSRTCRQCGGANALEASFCQFCGRALEAEISG